MRASPQRQHFLLSQHSSGSPRATHTSALSSVLCYQAPRETCGTVVRGAVDSHTWGRVQIDARKQGYVLVGTKASPWCLGGGDEAEHWQWEVSLRPAPLPTAGLSVLNLTFQQQSWGEGWWGHACSQSDSLGLVGAGLSPGLSPGRAPTSLRASGPGQQGAAEYPLLVGGSP